MATIENMEIPFTPELKEIILNDKIEKLKQSYLLKHKELEQQEKDEIEKIKTSLDKLLTISVSTNPTHPTTSKKKERKGWTESELTELKKLVDAGMKTQGIADKLNKPYQSVYYKIKELKEQV